MDHKEHVHMRLTQSLGHGLVAIFCEGRRKAHSASASAPVRGNLGPTMSCYQVPYGRVEDDTEARDVG
jgi:hypothetical protein